MKLLKVSVALMVILLSAPAWADNVDTQASVSNQAPTVVEVALVEDDDSGLPGAQIAPTPGASRTLSITARAQDGNGWRDLDSLSLEVTRPDGTVLASLSATPTGEHSGRTQVYSASFSIDYYEAPGTYTITSDVTDGPGSHGAHTDSFTYQSLLAFALGSSSISFSAGALDPGATSSVASVNVINKGNVKFDTQVSGTDLDAVGFDAVIPVGNVKYSADPAMAGEVGLAAAPQTDASFDLSPGAGAARNAFFDVHVPSGDDQFVPAANYVGSVTIGAVASP